MSFDPIRELVADHADNLDPRIADALHEIIAVHPEEPRTLRRYLLNTVDTLKPQDVTEWMDCIELALCEMRLAHANQRVPWFDWAALHDAKCEYLMPNCLDYMAGGARYGDEQRVVDDATIYRFNGRELKLQRNMNPEDLELLDEAVAAKLQLEGHRDGLIEAIAIKLADRDVSIVDRRIATLQKRRQQLRDAFYKNRVLRTHLSPRPKA